MKKFFWQERVWTCGPASLKIALARLSVNKSEKYLAKLLKATPRHGVSNAKFIKAAQRLKLQYLFGKSDLVTINHLLKDKWQIIVNYYSNLHGAGHFAVINKITKDRVYLADPASGPNISFNKNYFNKHWHSSRGDIDKWFFAIKKK